jgi:hypothetical protein
MAIDQRDVSSTLRFMDDRALQQYAAMHKNDPYIFPLAFQESQNRQKLRMSQQRQMAQQPQPKVADQALAQMMPQQPRPMAQPMPEAQGIGALPAGNMEGMADGGIAGYEGYDESGVPNTFGEGPVRMMAEGGVARYQVGGDTMGGFSGMSPEQEAALEIRAENEQKLRQLNDLEKQATFLESAGAPQAQQVRAQANALKSIMGPKPSPTDPSFRRQPDPRMQPGVAATAQPLVTSGAAPTVDTGRKAPAAAPAAAPAVPEQTAAQRYAAMQKGLEPERAEIDKGIAALSASKRKTAADELAEFEKDVAERGVAFKGREERLAKREEGLSKRKDDLGSFAMLEFGLGLLAEPGKFAQAVGRVGQRTATNYSAGLKDLRAAQEKMDDARDQIEEFRRNEANMTATERRKFKSAIGRTENEIEQLGLNAAEKMYGNKRDDAKTIFTAETQERISDKENKTRLQAARIGATQQTPAQIQIATALGKGDLEAGLVKMRAIEAGKFSVSNSYADYLKAFAGKETLTPPLSFANYAAQFGATLPR